MWKYKSKSIVVQGHQKNGATQMAPLVKHTLSPFEMAPMAMTCAIGGNGAIGDGTIANTGHFIPRHQ